VNGAAARSQLLFDMVGTCPSIGVEGKIVVVEIIHDASSCEAGRGVDGNEGKLPRVPNGIQDAIANGGGDSGNGNVVHGKNRFGVPSDLLESLLVGHGLQDELEVEGEGRVVLTEVDEGDDVFFLSKEVAEVDGGGGERSRVEGGHVKNEEVGSKKAGWLGCECLDNCLRTLLQMFPPFITLKNLGGILQVAFQFPRFVRVSLPYYQILIASASFPVIFD